MEFWLKKDDADKFQLPVNPESFELSEKQANTVVNVNAIGEINLLGKRGLREGTISSFFPNRDYNFAVNSNRKKPYKYVKKIRAWKNANTPIRLIICGNGKSTGSGGKRVNMLVTIESFKWGEQDGTRDIYFELTLKEYREVSVEKVSKSFIKKYGKKKKSKKSNRSKKTTKKQTYKIKKGDTLFKIAKKFYGKGSKWKKIYNANKKKIKNPNKLKVGTKITIPKG